MTKTKHILFVLDYFLPHLWWAENVFDHIIQWLLAKWYKISVLTSKHDKKLPDVEVNENLKIYRVWTNRFNLIRYALPTWIKILKNENIDLIYTTTYTAWLPAKILWVLFKKKIIITVHEVFGNLRFKYKKFFPALMSWLFEKVLISLNFDKYHAVSWYTYNVLRISYLKNDKKLHKIYNWVDHDFWSEKNINVKIVDQMKKMYNMDWKFVLMYMGHTWKSKGLDYLLQAIPKILKKDPDKWKNLVFVFNLLQARRDWEVRKTISSLKRKYKILKTNIILFDWTLLKKDLLHRVACADCVIVPSISDWFWLVAAEVSSLWKPLIVSWCSALPEVVWWTIRWIQPWDTDSIVEAFFDMKNYIQNWENNWTIHSLPKYKFFWSKSLMQIQNLIESLIN